MPYISVYIPVPPNAAQSAANVLGAGAWQLGALAGLRTLCFLEVRLRNCLTPALQSQAAVQSAQVGLGWDVRGKRNMEMIDSHIKRTPKNRPLQ